MKFAYVGFDRGGKRTSATIEATALPEAAEALRRQGLFISEIGPAEEKAHSASASGDSAAAVAGLRMRRGQRLRYLAMFARQLHVLVSSGTPLVQALTAIERQSDSPRWSRVVTMLRKDVEEGAPLSQAMYRLPRFFDAVCVSLVAAGEASGALAQMLDRLASLLRKQLQLRQAVLGAMVYPCVLVVLGFGVLVLMLLFVLPRFAVLFESLDSPLPPTTKLLLWLSDILKAYWWGFLLAAVSVGVGGRMWLSNPGGRRSLHRLALNLPRFGRLARSIMTARMSRMLGVLLESRVPLTECLQLTRQSMMNVFYAELIANAEEAVGRGEPVSAVLCESDLVTPCVQEAIRNGEASGQLGTPLLHMADFLDEENDVIVKSLTRIIEPMILGVLGVIVGFIAMSMFLPLFDLVSSAEGGG